VLILSVPADEPKDRRTRRWRDDYLRTRCGELLARIRVLLRRAQPAGEVSIARFGEIEVDFTKRTVTRPARSHLTVKEYALLRLAAPTPRQSPSPHASSCATVWGPGTRMTALLRVTWPTPKKLEPTARAALRENESGIGYVS